MFIKSHLKNIITSIGFLGEFLKILSFWMKSRHSILITQAIASVVLSLFWYLIKENGLAFVSFINLIINIHADNIKNKK